MNHNGVISLPINSSAAAADLTTGSIVGINSSGEVVAGTVANHIGVMLHDSDPTASDLPAAVHLFSAGGIFNVRALSTTTVGAPHNVGAKGLASSAGSAAAGTHRLVPLEATGSTGGVIRAILQS